MEPNIRHLSRVTSRYSFYILGGPLANMAAALLALPVALTHTTAGGICRIFVIASVGFSFLNLFPGYGPVGRSDGGKLYDIVFRPTRREELLFRFCIRMRLLEIRHLSQEHRHREALGIFEEQMRLTEKLLRDERNTSFRNWMASLQPKLEQALAACDHQSDFASISELTSDVPAGTEPA